MGVVSLLRRSLVRPVPLEPGSERLGLDLVARPEGGGIPVVGEREFVREVLPVQLDGYEPIRACHLSGQV